MLKTELDYDHISNVISEKQDKLPLIGNEHRLIRVAFDLFRLNGDSTEDLWQIQNTDDGEFIVRTFDLQEEESVTKKSNWNVVADSSGRNLTITYRNIPLHKVASNKYNANTLDEVNLLQRTLRDKLSTDKSFVKLLLKEIPSNKLAELNKESNIINDINNELQDFTNNPISGNHLNYLEKTVVEEE